MFNVHRVSRRRRNIKYVVNQFRISHALPEEKDHKRAISLGAPAGDYRSGCKYQGEIFDDGA